jgi:WD40 repeat protein
VRIWDAESGVEIIRLTSDPAGLYSIVHDLAFDPQGRQMAVCDRTREDPPRFRIRVTDALSTQELYSLAGPWTRATFHPDGLHLAAFGSPDREFVILKRDSLVEIARAQGGDTLCFSADGSRLAATIDSEILLYETSPLKRLAIITGHEGPVYSTCFSPDGHRLASAGLDQTVRLWDVHTGKQINELRGHTDRVYTVVFSQDGTRLASGSNDRTIRLWDSRTFDEVLQLSGHQDYVYSLRFSPDDGRRLISGSGDGTIRIWESTPLRVRTAAWRARQDGKAVAPESPNEIP